MNKNINVYVCRCRIGAKLELKCRNRGRKY